MDFRALTGIHFGQLCFFEVCRYPGVTDGDNHHQRLSQNQHQVVVVMDVDADDLMTMLLVELC